MDIETIKKLIGTNATIIEIGCANGEDTIKLLTLGKVYGFEPEPNNIKILKNIPELNLFEGVVSDIDGELNFNRSRTSNREDLRLSGSIMKPKNHLNIWNWIFFDETIPVKSVTLDSFCKDMGIIDFIWCDAQGAEKKIILGGNKTLKNTRFFYTEYCNNEQYENQPTLSEISELLPDFEIMIDYGTDVLLRNKNI